MRARLREHWAAPAQEVPPLGFVRLREATCLGPIVFVDGLLVLDTVEPQIRPWEPDEGVAAAIDKYHHALAAQAVPHAAGPERALLGARLYGDSNYGHWLTEVVPVLALARRHLPDVPLLVDAGGAMRAHQQRLLDDTLRVPAGLRIALGAAPLRCRELWLPFGFQRHPLWKAPECVATLRQAFLGAQAAPPDEAPVLFVQRRARQCANQDELAALIGATLGAPRIHRYDGEPVEEQAALFARARMIVGTHGADMANSVFARPGTPVVHLAPETRSGLYFWDLSCLAGLRHCEVRGPQRAGDRSFTIEPRLLAQALRAAA